MCFTAKVADPVAWKGRILINFRGSWFDTFHGHHTLVTNHFLCSLMLCLWKEGEQLRLGFSNLRCMFFRERKKSLIFCRNKRLRQVFTHCKSYFKYACTFLAKVRLFDLFEINQIERVMFKLIILSHQNIYNLKILGIRLIA